MIAWRHLVLTALGVALVAVAIAHASGSVSCEHADSLAHRWLLSDARTAYLSVLHSAPSSGCASRGLKVVTKRQCHNAMAIAAVDPDGEQKALLAISEYEPRQATAADCAVVPLMKLQATLKAAASRQGAGS